MDPHSGAREVVIAPSSVGSAWEAEAEAEDMPRKVEGSTRRAAGTVTDSRDTPDKEPGT